MVNSESGVLLRLPLIKPSAAAVCTVAIHRLLPGSSSHRRQNCNLAILRKSGVEQLFASNVLVVKKNVDVLPELASFIQHSIAQAWVQLP